MRILADLAYLILGMLLIPVALYQAVFLRKNRRGWRQRFGAVPGFTPGRPRIWIHGVSLGEINAAQTLVQNFQKEMPQLDIVVSSTTDTGFARAVQLYGAARVFRYPLDFSFVVRRVLGRVRPSLIVLMELEVWFNLIREATRRGIPVIVANGRLTRRSARRLRLLGPVSRFMFERLTWVGAQDSAIAERFRSLGTPEDRVEIVPSLKWDTATVADQVPGAQALAEAMGIDGLRPLIVCGSTGPGEEALILRAYESLVASWLLLARDMLEHHSGEQHRLPPLLALVPRKPERFDEVASLILRGGFTVVRRSQHPDGAVPPASIENAVLLCDTMGELRKCYALADIVFVGRTLVPLGGSDPMEVAALGKPMVLGPHIQNFEAPVHALLEADGARIVTGPEAWASTLAELLRNETLRSSMGPRAKHVVLSHQGGTRRTLERVLEILDDVQGHPRDAAEAPLGALTAGRD